jgi:hypothetical protein
MALKAKREACEKDLSGVEKKNKEARYSDRIAR